MYDLDSLITHNLQTYPDNHFYLQRELREQWEKTKPLLGVRILHNIPLTHETLIKLEPLLAAGAEVTVTHVQFLSPPNEQIVQLLENIGLDYVPNHLELLGEYDIALDCCAEVLDMPNIKILKGAVELTQTGGERYRQANIPFPVINVDDSRLKKLEGMYGTGEAFVRAIQELTQQSIKNQPFLLFGFGKVGRGIARYLGTETSKLTVVDQSERALNRAVESGFEALSPTQVETIKERAKQAFCIVTATGIPGQLAKYLNPTDCSQAYIANMGATDEIGSNFNHAKVLCSRKPVNFALKHPTLLHFIDPVFYAHNLAARLILEHNYAPGYHPFPSYLDDLIINMWHQHNRLDISDIFE
ncbi:NAD-binding protein [Legionella jordanis]|uniref:Adenosylhomocysteinase n=1 Tax=Legionella jordanis TaxID=456 RepID=A0A0W0VGP7_9GAMM|nr:NAD-binding protein [Legionella jordanis]KTD18934.1 adenosylhomocysteinase [Legionella jordanis]RMX05502.1 hypothetical protein EAW55_02285 [Legionella jordanis]RMX19187.1 hypothetical protein EAS68_07050 [Legionella jordanis]VEH13034.1 adenosylhomocysteinase [Legionella jordanis]HAT8714077.1 hypothetical protein [Legionella jordanis]